MVRDRMARGRDSLGVFGVPVTTKTVATVTAVAVTNFGSFLYTLLK